jgi:rhodanese-related sulfurtransferase
MKLVPETALVAALGITVGLIANAVSPRGLELGRNYFPASTPSTATTALPSPAASTNAGQTNMTAAAAEDPVFARLRSKGLHPATLDEVKQLQANPGFTHDQIVFLDDRDHEYAEGHIPGAYQFFHYRIADFLPQVYPLLQAAEKIVIYCTGGHCEDSEFAALMLAEMGIPKDRLIVFVGGIKEWKAAGLPVETGARKSGTFITPTR